MFNLRNELHYLAVLDNTKVSVLNRHAETTCRERADEYQLLSVLTDIDKPSSARQPRSKFADVQVALAVGLGEPKKGCIKAAAIVEVELIGLIDHGLCVDRRPEIEASRRHAANDARSE